VLGTVASGGFTKVERGLCNCYETPSRWRQRFKQVKKKNFYTVFVAIGFFPLFLPRGLFF